MRYRELARAAGETWRARGQHRATSDLRQDRVVLHAPNSTAFRELSAVLDALHGPKRALGAGANSLEIAAFAVAFAVD